jgi:hypothetical protein
MSRHVDEIKKWKADPFPSAQLRLLIPPTLRPLAEAHVDNLPRRHDVEEDADSEHGRRIEHVQTVQDTSAVCGKIRGRGTHGHSLFIMYPSLPSMNSMSR